jgi:malate synthase
MVINALNSGARVFMADFEDSSCPTWEGLLAGQQNLCDAVRRTISFRAESGREYRLVERPALLFVRPRGWHLPELHVQVDGQPMSGALFDAGLYLFHNARALVDRGSAPYLYLPKMEHHLEARLWDEVFVHVQEALGLPIGTIKATCLIETLPAAFQMHELLWELRRHSAGLNCGRWDYIFSYIKQLGQDPAALLPDRGLVTMTQPFLRAYSTRLIETCHRRGAQAMGGMAAQIPIKEDPEANARALERVRADKLREVTDGHDGTWVAHPGLVAVAQEIFDQHMPGPNQLHRRRPEDDGPDTSALLRAPEGPRSVEGLRHNIRVGLRYVEAWLRGVGCVPIYNLMEDAATAEISRAQLWQWRHHGAAVGDAPLSAKRLLAEIDGQMPQIAAEVGEIAWSTGRWPEARALFEELVLAERFTDFLTLPAYTRVVAQGG